MVPPPDGGGTSAVPADQTDDLGGRLALLASGDLDDEQREMYTALTQTVVPEAAEHGFTARLDDGRFVGPFNALLRVPAIAMGMGMWTSRIAASGIAPDVRQAVILTVGAAWSADFEIDAHTAAARAVGIPDGAIAAIVRQEAPSDLGRDADVAHRVTCHLLARQGLPDALYHQAIAVFGEAGLTAILCLIGQYQTISSILVCFKVPVPARPHPAADVAGGSPVPTFRTEN
jgi:4-carboxymuconolactone decarboxylase